MPDRRCAAIDFDLTSTGLRAIAHDLPQYRYGLSVKIARVGYAADNPTVPTANGDRQQARRRWCYLEWRWKARRRGCVSGTRIISAPQ